MVLSLLSFREKLVNPESRQDFAELCRLMRAKWFFRNETTPQFSEVTASSPKSCRKLPKRYPNLEVFLSQLENDIFKMTFGNLKHSKISKEEWQAIRALVNDRTIVIKRADKESCVIVWDRMDYLLE